MHIQPYLFYEGRCEEAMAFYEEALGAERVALMRFSDSPEPLPPGAIPAGAEANVMHACLKIGDSMVMMSDGYCAKAARFEGVALSLTVPTPADAERRFAALSEGGEVRMPLGPTFFSPSFGMVADRFGVAWMINTQPEG
ncbi:VOC family protein [Methylopila sp. 73B]|uniref:VOC family protein n=1 Tax=Methylopila sp. 73B TaxID=1120792 RepID=UPI000381400E|nr:VOC family protein [Methylopila sp. 73B]